ncbi:hypothetical protein HZS_591 [Henneguya salminicola]|nr:hypothetical protein HZS_591 [Henneguya salminicola]
MVKAALPKLKPRNTFLRVPVGELNPAYQKTFDPKMIAARLNKFGKMLRVFIFSNIRHSFLSNSRSYITRMNNLATKI